MTFYLMFLLSLAILISYIVISLSKETKFRIKRTVNKIDPLEYRFTIEKQHKVFKYWHGPCDAKDSGEITDESSQHTWTYTLPQAQKLLDDYAKWLNHKDKYYQVEYLINTKEID